MSVPIYYEKIQIQHKTTKEITEIEGIIYTQYSDPKSLLRQVCHLVRPRFLNPRHYVILPLKTHTAKVLGFTAYGEF